MVTPHLLCEYTEDCENGQFLTIGETDIPSLIIGCPLYLSNGRGIYTCILIGREYDHNNVHVWYESGHCPTVGYLKKHAFDI